MGVLNRSLPSRLPRSLIVAGLGATLLCGGIGGAVLWLPEIEARQPAHDPEPAPLRAYTVVRKPIVSELDVVGQVQPASRSIALAPFDGYIATRHVAFGDWVKRGDPLVTLDTSGIDTQLREAESAFLKAAMTFDALTKWDSGPDVTRARRTLAAAQTTLDSTERQLKDSKSLLDRGIISRNEYETLQLQAANQRDTLASSRQDLDATLIRGSTDNRRMAELDLKSARARLDALRQEADQRVVRAPMDGFVMRPPVSSSDKDSGSVLETGIHLSKGQALLSISGLDLFEVDAAVDEVDVDKVMVGQPVRIDSDSFPGSAIDGKITRVNIEANPGGGSGNPSKFAVIATFEADAVHRTGIRVGMSARLTIATYSNPNALLVPQDAVFLQTGTPTVHKLDPNSHQPRDVTVVLGPSTQDGVEVKEGLSEGDVISLP